MVPISLFSKIGRGPPTVPERSLRRERLLISSEILRANQLARGFVIVEQRWNESPRQNRFHGVGSVFAAQVSFQPTWIEKGHDNPRSLEGWDEVANVAIDRRLGHRIGQQLGDVFYPGGRVDDPPVSPGLHARNDEVAYFGQCDDVDLEVFPIVPDRCRVGVPPRSLDRGVVENHIDAPEVSSALRNID